MSIKKSVLLKKKEYCVRSCSLQSLKPEKSHHFSLDIMIPLEYCYIYSSQMFQWNQIECKYVGYPVFSRTIEATGCHDWILLPQRSKSEKVSKRFFSFY